MTVQHPSLPHTIDSYIFVQGTAGGEWGNAHVPMCYFLLHSACYSLIKKAKGAQTTKFGSLEWTFHPIPTAISPTVLKGEGPKVLRL